MKAYQLVTFSEKELATPVLHISQNSDLAGLFNVLFLKLICCHSIQKETWKLKSKRS